jgi:glycosyltransferase involved in cell wall biosynthesis
MDASRLPLSAVIITKNAAAQLPACLDALRFCDEALVVDSGSADATVTIAHEWGARVVETHWRGYGPQKQFAIEQAAYDWVLCVDADERVSDALRESIRGILTRPEFSAYRFPRCNRFMGRYLRHGEGYPDWSLRLFDRRLAHWSDDVVHERVVATEPVGTLAGDLMHDSAESLESYLEKQNRYSTLAAQTALAAGKRGSVASLLLSPLLRFIRFYLLKGGFRDGVPGLVHILCGCYASFAKHAKLLAGKP